ncbi:MAG: signal peptidase II [Clostridiaceae bacterium]|nr:signal peptidase II [Clostridiaceae bacterium]
MVITIVIILLSAADQLIKALVRGNLTASDRIPVIDGFFYIIYRENRGAAWSFLAGPEWGIYILSGLSLIMTIVLALLLIRIRHTGLRVCLTMIISGSIGNLIDRVRLGAVTDYLDFHFGSYVFPTFNLADSLIVVGTALLCLLLLKTPHLIDLLIPDKNTKTDQSGTEAEKKEEPHAPAHPDN